MKNKIFSGIVTTSLLFQIAPMSIFANEIENLGEKQSIEQVKNSVNDNIKSSTVINIPDQNLKKALNEKLSQDKDNPITKGQLESITGVLNLSNKNITTIEGIQYCSNLQKLILENNKISDITPLAHMNAPTLDALRLHNNKISNIAPLANLNAPKLKWLFLNNNKISDIAPLLNVHFTNLFQLYLDGNKISDINQLINLNFPKLNTLSLSSTGINDLTILPNLNLPNLESLFLEGNEISDISPLSNLNNSKLARIWLGSNKISDISPLNNLNAPKLEAIRLNNNRISDISPLKNLNSATLKRLELDDQNFTNDKKWSKGKFFQIKNSLKDMDGNIIIPTLNDDGTYITDNPDYPTGLMKWNNINKLANNEEGKIVELTYTFNKNFTAGANNTEVTFNGTVHQPVEYYKGFKPVINAPDVIIKKGTAFNPMEGVTATDKVGELDDKGNLIDPNEKAKDITKDVKVIQNNVNPYKVGTYIVKYEVTDSWGNTVTKDRKVIVADTLMVEEIVGSDRYNTANKISDKWTRADNVVIANSDSIVDAMTASPFAHAKNAPVLLSSKSSLTPETKASIARLQAKTVYLIGGENSLDKNLEKEIRDMGVNVVRIAGKDRFETSLKIAKEVDNLSDVSQVAIVNGQKGLPDAISISSPAAMNNMPIILSNNAGDIPQGKDFIKTEDLSKAYVIGGNGTVSEKLKTEVSDLIKNKPVDRLGGKDRLETNTIILNEFYKSGALNNLFVVKDGAKRDIDLIDSLSVSSLAAKEKSPIMIVGDNLTPEQTTFVKKKTFDKLTRVGGNGNENAFNKIVDLVKK
ncbi:cell wall-binding repeat-containing protein [Romboutsia sp. MSSM.1001216sp_RTP31141st1_F12_RTP31141_220114]|uniref:cell wall-binding repeat-containing protein n=2 Tax=unclassified Romboutsia TaxID=2626894 RepID=UPI0031B56BA5